MKNQYFGDINDYRKYHMLRVFIESGFKPITVVWMLTKDTDLNGDGKKIQYLENARYKDRDPQLHSILSDSIARNVREVSVIEKSGYLEDAIFFGDPVPNKESVRSEWFERIKLVSKDSSLVFFDPDNGFEVKSIRKQNAKSEKYLFWDEIDEIFKTGKSVLIYQHFSREKRDAHIRRIAEKAFAVAASSKVFIIQTPHVFFLLLLNSANTKEAINLLEHLRNSDSRDFNIFKLEKNNNATPSIIPVYHNQVLENEYIEYIKSMTRKDFSSLLQLIPEIEKTKVFGKIREGSMQEHAVIFPLLEEGEIVEKFRTISYDLKLVIPFNWGGWKEGKEVYEKDSCYSDLDIVTLCKLITAIIRNDRFCEGFLISAFEEGKISRILHAMDRNLGTKT